MNLDQEILAAWQLMSDIGDLTRGERGITRDAFGDGEDLAAEAVRVAAMQRDLPAWYDHVGNLHCYLAGTDPTAKEIVIGSHVDSVPSGGNFDGLMGVVAGLAILVALRDAALSRPLRLIAFRGEESPWFGQAYLGSRLALGHGSLAELGPLLRTDTGLPLSEHLARLGLSERKTTPATPFRPDKVEAYLELHIEQGPLLLTADQPVAVGRAIRGNVRFPNASCRGEYAHSSGAPRETRRDCVLALADLALFLDELWAQRLQSIDDSFVFTIGKVATNPKEHAITKVAGELDFSLNFGSISPEIMKLVRREVLDRIEGIEATRRVQFDLGPEVGTTPTPLDPELSDTLRLCAEALGVPCGVIPTVGHDAAMFVLKGIPAAVLLVRNRNGSHNPDETMEFADFASATLVAAEAVTRWAGAPTFSRTSEPA